MIVEKKLDINNKKKVEIEEKLVEENKYMRIDIKYLKDHIDSVKYNFDLYTIIFFGIIVIYLSYKFIKSNSLFIFWK